MKFVHLHFVVIFKTLPNVLNKVHTIKNMKENV